MLDEALMELGDATDRWFFIQGKWIRGDALLFRCKMQRVNF
jgi:hypothetical protein